MIVGILAVLVFGARIVVSFQERENRKEQLRMMEELSRKQRDESWGQTHTEEALKEALDLNLDETLKSLDSTKKNLDEIGKRLDSLGGSSVN
jgi:hypothetical protein